MKFTWGKYRDSKQIVEAERKGGKETILDAWTKKPNCGHRNGIKLKNIEIILHQGLTNQAISQVQSSTYFYK